MEMLVGVSGETGVRAGGVLGFLSVSEGIGGISLVGETWKRPTVTTGFGSKGEHKIG